MTDSSERVNDFAAPNTWRTNSGGFAPQTECIATLRDRRSCSLWRSAARLILSFREGVGARAIAAVLDMAESETRSESCFSAGPKAASDVAVLGVAVLGLVQRCVYSVDRCRVSGKQFPERGKPIVGCLQHFPGRPRRGFFQRSAVRVG